MSGCGLDLLGATIFKKKEELAFGFKSVFLESLAYVCVHLLLQKNRILKRLTCTSWFYFTFEE